MEGKLGHWAFILGVVLAIILGLFPTLTETGTASVILVILGIIIGLLNVPEKETQTFLIAAIALMVGGAGGLDQLPSVGSWLGPILTNVVTIVAPAAVILGVKTVYDLAKKN